MAKVLISGSYGTGNTGDEAILDSILEHYKLDDVTILSQGIEYTKRYFPKAKVIHQCPSLNINRILKDILKLRFHELKKRLSFFKALLECDVFHLGGGGLLSALIPTTVPYYLGQIKWAKRFNKKIIVFCIGVGPIKNPKTYKDISKVFKEVKLLSVRDQISIDHMKASQIEHAFIMPDPAFALPIELHEHNGNLEKNKIVVNLYNAFSDQNVWPKEQHNQFLEFINNILNELEKRNEEIVLLSFGTESDASFVKEIIQKRKGTSIKVAQYNNHRLIIKELQSAKYTITMRFHAALLSFTAGIPSLCIDQQFKSERLLNEMNLEQLLISLPDGHHKSGIMQTDIETFRDKIKYLDDNYDSLTPKIINYCLKQKNEYFNHLKKFT